MLHTIRDGLLGKRSVKTVGRRASGALRKSRLELEALEAREVPSVTYSGRKHELTPIFPVPDTDFPGS
jgi:hypothetical protein